ncbi:predicted protein [Sclerotinia sclerotiorum 1980 UF-70]|uniref:Uncharacterized protein n=1 Tax=Sclerotinia sclerotiorum (strain ATCC 18683 / 1980 / Ss-1) TaxID=665079 RepID=A7ETL8_SCLS1|nr:predicted protein [Sclerotinia sclerotiorum 1980 UF-70]EDN92810.1 predicted protein [Sclerotinia sclerotiorum 1980 UF-70]
MTDIRFDRANGGQIDGTLKGTDFLFLGEWLVKNGKTGKAEVSDKKGRIAIGQSPIEFGRECRMVKFVRYILMLESDSLILSRQREHAEGNIKGRKHSSSVSYGCCRIGQGKSDIEDNFSYVSYGIFGKNPLMLVVVYEYLPSSWSRTIDAQ